MNEHKAALNSTMKFLIRCILREARDKELDREQWRQIIDNQTGYIVAHLGALYEQFPNLVREHYTTDELIDILFEDI